MREILKSKKVLLVGLVLPTIALVNWGIGFRCSKIYSNLVANSSVISAFYEGNGQVIESVAAKNGLFYQRVEKGTIAYSSRSWLPKSDIILYNQKVADGVILPEITDSLKSLQFYKIFRGASVYVMFPICTEDCSSEMYIVYKKALI